MFYQCQIVYQGFYESLKLNTKFSMSKSKILINFINSSFIFLSLYFHYITDWVWSFMCPSVLRQSIISVRLYSFIIWWFFWVLQRLSCFSTFHMFFILCWPFWLWHAHLGCIIFLFKVLMLVSYAVNSSLSSFFLNFRLEWFGTVFLKDSLIFLLSSQSAIVFCCKAECLVKLEQVLPWTSWGHRWAPKTITIVLSWHSLQIFTPISFQRSPLCNAMPKQFSCQDPAKGNSTV